MALLSDHPCRLIFPSGEGRDDEQLVRACGVWRKFTALTDLLEYSLADVAEWLPRKKFASFTGSEVPMDYMIYV